MSPEDLTLTIHCPDKEPTYYGVSKGSGHLKFPLNCQISTKNYLIPAISEIHGKYVDSNYSVTPFKMNISHMEPQIKEIIQNIEVKSILENSDNRTTSLRNLQQKLKVIKLKQHNTAHHLGVSWSSLAMGACGLIVALGLGGAWLTIYLKCKLQRKQALRS